MSIRIRAFLKKAQESDLFYPNTDMKKNNPLFFKSYFTDKFEGPYYSDHSCEYYELMVKQSIGMVYVLIYQDPEENDIAIKLELEPTTLFDIKESPKQLFIGRPYFIKKEKLSGPHLLQNDTDPFLIKKLLDNNEMYSINTNQKIELLTNQKVAV